MALSLIASLLVLLLDLIKEINDSVQLIESSEILFCHRLSCIFVCLGKRLCEFGQSILRDCVFDRSVLVRLESQLSPAAFRSTWTNHI